jgi:hypothetical protein
VPQHPKSRCSRCHMVFYCSKDCQKVDWKISQVRLSYRCSIENLAGPDSTFRFTSPGRGNHGNYSDEIWGKRSLRNLFSRAIVDPGVCIKCKHISCWSCLHHLQSSNAVNKCPHCGSEMPELVQPTLTKANAGSASKRFYVRGLSRCWKRL